MKRWRRETVEGKLRSEYERFSTEIKDVPVKSVALSFLLGVVLTTYPYQVGGVFLFAGLFVLAGWYFGEHEGTSVKQVAEKTEVGSDNVAQDSKPYAEEVSKNGHVPSGEHDQHVN